MNRQAQSSITEMLNSFGQTSQNYEVFLLTLGRLCGGLSDQAIIEAADRFAAGDVKDQNKKFPPTSAEFVEEARRRQEFIANLAAPRLPSPAPRTGPTRFEIARQKALDENAGRPILHENISHTEFQHLSRQHRLPTGAKWVARLGTIYGPASTGAS